MQDGSNHTSAPNVQGRVGAPLPRHAQSPPDKPQYSLSHSPAPGRAHDASWRKDMIRLLKDALIKELVYVIRCTSLSNGTPAPSPDPEFLLHIYDKLAHAHRLTQRVIQLGGELEYSLPLLIRQGEGIQADGRALKAMLAPTLVSEYRAIGRYTEIISRIETDDDAARRLMEEIVRDEMEHAEKLRDWLSD